MKIHMILLKKLLLLSIVPLVISSAASAQKNFREGYLIKNNGDVLNGLIEYKSNQDVPAVCIFKRFEIATEIPYGPGEIMSFGYINGNRYESKKVSGKDSFYEVLVSGKITLYRTGSKYFLQKEDSGLTSLNESTIEYTSKGQSQKFDGLTPFLRYITEGKVETIKEKTDPKQDLEPVIIEFNRNSGNAYYVYKHDASKQALPGLTYTSADKRK